jgi:hypothetical protein
VTTYEKAVREGLKSVFWLAVVAFAILELLSSSLAEKVRYSIQYEVPMGQVKRTPKPSSCDWGYAPLGEKGCHWEKVISGLNANGDLVAGTDAPVFSTDKNTGKPIMIKEKGCQRNRLP